VARYRVVLRPPSAADEPEFLARVGASRALHAPWVSMPRTGEAYAAYLERSQHASNAFYLAHRREDDAIVGFLNISEIIRGKLQSAFLGYGAVAEFTGRGYLTEALQLVLTDAFRRLRLHRLEANIQPGNIASIALAQRCGFESEGFSARYLKVGGRWRDHERWAITRERWLHLRRAGQLEVEGHGPHRRLAVGSCSGRPIERPTSAVAAHPDDVEGPRRGRSIP
jgi:ribosomal-protein-alanine N-acetyltransferase